jgi:hypothetical protein
MGLEGVNKFAVLIHHYKCIEATDVFHQHMDLVGREKRASVSGIL